MLDMIKGVFVSPDYSLKDINASVNTGVALSWNNSFFQDYVKIDLRNITQLHVPIYIVQGKYGRATPLTLVEQFYEQVNASQGKHIIVLKHSAYYPISMTGKSL
jgi:hypothetical protein